MEIRVQLHGALRRYRPKEVAPTGAFSLEVTEGATVADVIDLLVIPSSWVRGRFVNERTSDLTQPLRPGDELVLFPPVGGGSSGCSVGDEPRR